MADAQSFGSNLHFADRSLVAMQFDQIVFGLFSLVPFF